MFGLPRRVPLSLAAASAALVLAKIIARSFSASAGYRCKTNGSTSGPALERVGALARLDLDMLGDELEALGLGEAS